MSKILHPAAEPAWAAYEAMGESKTSYFASLQALEEKYAKYGKPSEAENARLSELLAAHDACVARFKKELNELKTTSLEGNQSLIERLAAEAG